MCDRSVVAFSPLPEASTLGTGAGPGICRPLWHLCMDDSGRSECPERPQSHGARERWDGGSSHPKSPLQGPKPSGVLGPPREVHLPFHSRGN